MKFLKLFTFILFFSTSYGLHAQNNKAVVKKKTTNKYPESFSIARFDFDNLFNYKVRDILEIPANKYIHKSLVQMNSLNGDIKFLKLKLNYFSKAYLLIQVNGSYSTQIFIMSEDKSIFYKGVIESNLVTMTKCAEDEIVSE